MARLYLPSFKLCPELSTTEEESVIVKNTNNEEIGRVSISESEIAMQDIVKNNKDRFTKKKVYLVLENDNLNLQKVEGM